MRGVEVSCLGCGSNELTAVYRTKAVPLHSCLLFDDREAALAFPRADIDLELCATCGLIQNVAFDPAAMDYSSDYEDSQANSPRFLSFAIETIDRLVETYGLSGGHVVEIGCGKGDYLVLLANRADMTGVGIDPAYRPGPLIADRPDRLRFVNDRFAAGDDLGDPDLVVCRHTLEHVPDVGAFIAALRDALDDRPEAVVFFEVPDSARILSERAFWDIYYEHCSYFVESSLTRLFEVSGFEVLETWLGMEGQYLMLVARPAARSLRSESVAFTELDEVVADFERDVAGQIARLRADLDAATAEGRTVVLWGASSKAVSYLHALGLDDEVTAVVDINPVKRGKFLAGSGHRIVSPADLVEIRPDTVIVMNPVYRDEIETDLEAMGLEPRIMAL